MRRLITLLVLAALQPACLVFHLDKNAPGDSPILTTPEDLDAERLEPPTDPGESITRLTWGPYGYIGGAFPAGRSGTFLGEAGIELSLAGWDRSISHRAEDHHALNFPDQPIYSFNLSWAFLQGIDDELRLGPVFAELQLMSAPENPLTTIGGAVGAGVDFDRQLFSVQATLLFLMGSNGVRVRYAPGAEGVSVGWYVTYKLPVIWVRSR